MPYVAASPDDIFRCKCCEPAVVEYKCPFTTHGKPITEAYTYLDYLKNAADGVGIVLKKSHRYYTQIQAQMACTGFTKGYFVVWTGHGKDHILVIDVSKVYLS